MDGWQWLFEYCLRHKPPLRFIPGKCEPWVEYKVAAELLQCEVSTVERKAKSVKRHPVFAGLIQMSSFEDVA